MTDQAETSTPIDNSTPESGSLPRTPTPIDPTSDLYHTGQPFPQGATWDGEGVNFALFSDNATAVELCLFDHSEDAAESQRIRIAERTGGNWHIYIPGLKPGQLYGYRVFGPYDPENGHRFNPNKIVLDPYAKAIGRDITWADELFGYEIGHDDVDCSFDARDSAPFAPLAIVPDDRFDWGDDAPPQVAWHDTVIYETHVKGLTMKHPDVPADIRGTYAGVASKPMIDHFKKLGITAVELMPVHYFTNDRYLIERGLSNYWGYNTLGFFSPQPTFAACKDHPFDVVTEFKQMVKDLHAAGLEVILDVVYNHTAEGNRMGPTLSFRGIDNLSYYRTVEGTARYYMDYTGCGNTLNMVHPHSLQLLMDSLRYWVTEMHVDGFRFDLASALAREFHAVDQLGAFFDTIYQDPTLASVKLIAEPWDLGEGGYQVGNFPIGWTEWNGKYRDVVRKFWKGDLGLHGEIATRLGGSADLYERTRRRPSASINFITAHDGFTLHDLVSYNEKHNMANMEDGNDGANDNESWNCGAEGETSDPNIVELRERQKRNFLATLLFSQGVPMISGGDEIGRTQNGNNNVYCQDNELAWYDWDLDESRKLLLEFTARLVHYRREHPNFHRHSYHEEDPFAASESENVRWVRSDGQPMGEQDWEDGGWMRTLGMLLFGDAPEIRDAHGKQVKDDDFLLLINAHYEQVRFRLPPDIKKEKWVVAFDTARPSLKSGKEKLRASSFKLSPRSFVVLRHAK